MKVYTTIGVAWLAVLCGAGAALSGENLWSDNGTIGIGTTAVNSAYKLQLEQNADSESKHGAKFQVNVSGSPSGANMNNYGIIVDLDSDANGTLDVNDRLSLYGTANNLAVNGDTYLASPTLNYLYNNPGKTLTNGRTNYNFTSNAGTLTNSIGTYNLIRNENGGSVTNAFGSYSHINQKDDNSTINSSYAYFARQDHDAGVSSDSRYAWKA